MYYCINNIIIIVKKYFCLAMENLRWKYGLQHLIKE